MRVHAWYFVDVWMPMCACLPMVYMRVCARVLARGIEREEGWALSIRDGFDIPQERVGKVSNNLNRGQSPDRSLC